MTLPSIITKYQKKQTVERLKKAYSVMSNAFNYAESIYGPISSWPEVDRSAGGSTDEENYDFVMRYLSPALHLKYTTRPKNAYSKTTYIIGINNIGNLNAGSYPSGKWFYLDDGTCFKVLLRFSTGEWCYLFYDINGNAKPNIVGKDIFLFDFGYQQFYKFGFQATTWNRNNYKKGQAWTKDALLKDTCSKTEGGYYGGNGCGWIIQYDGWEIKDDYPW